MKRRRWLLIILVGLLGLCLCSVVGLLFGGDKAAEVAPSSMPSPTEAERPTVTPRPTATATPIISRGIGSLLEDWGQAHRRGQDNAGFVDYDAGKWTVAMMSDQGLCHIERNYGNNPPTLEQARSEMGGMLPVDAVAVKTYSPGGRPEAVVDLYRSEWLRSRFTDDVWIGADPGQFMVLYKVFDGRVARAIAACGNNP